MEVNNHLEWEKLLSKEIIKDYKCFMDIIVNHFTMDDIYKDTIYAVRKRLKSIDSMNDKLQRKKLHVSSLQELYPTIKDYAGVRVLVLYTHQIEEVHRIISDKISTSDWAFDEAPKAYTWDPEVEAFFEKMEIKTEEKSSLYTSVHYIVKPNNQTSKVCCEIQVRTLYEEICGEVDHMMNYPHPTSSSHCAEQLKVLARLTTTATKLLDSIHKSHSALEKD